MSFGLLQLLVLSAAVGLGYENKFRNIDSAVEEDNSGSDFRSDLELAAIFDSSVDVREKGEILYMIS